MCMHRLVVVLEHGACILDGLVSMAGSVDVCVCVCVYVLCAGHQLITTSQPPKQT